MNNEFARPRRQLQVVPKYRFLLLLSNTQIDGFCLTTEIDYMRIRLLAVFFIGIFLLLPFGLAQTTAGLDSIPAHMHDVIVANEVPGAVTVVATPDSVVRMDAQGWADPEHKSFMRVDSIFWIASMSKPITASAVLLLIEEGKLFLHS